MYWFPVCHFRCKEFNPLVIWIWNQNITISTIAGTSSHNNVWLNFSRLFTAFVLLHPLGKYTWSNFFTWDTTLLKRLHWLCSKIQTTQGRIQGEAPPPPPPLKFEKISFFGVKSWFFTRNTPTFSRLPPQLEEIWFFFSKIVIFHTK
jgi:hypothetical protein